LRWLLFLRRRALKERGVGTVSLLGKFFFGDEAQGRVLPVFARTSVRTLKKLRSSLVTISSVPSRGLVKLGQPVPLSNLSREEKSGLPDTMQTYKPSSWLSQYSFWNARSVPSSRTTFHCSGVSFFFSSSSGGTEKSGVFMEITGVVAPAAASAAAGEETGVAAGAAGPDGDSLWLETE
jgi:hypothetical protein